MNKKVLLALKKLQPLFKELNENKYLKTQEARAALDTTIVHLNDWKE